MDRKKIIVYGAIDGTDESADFDQDGIPDFKDSDTARMRHPGGIETVLVHTSAGDLSNVACLADDDPTVPQAGKPDRTFPYGVNRFSITGLTSGESVTVTLHYPDIVPTTARFHKTDASDRWGEIDLGSHDGDQTVTIVLTDGDPTTDGDGAADGTITDPGALTTDTGTTAPPVESADDDSGCFLRTLWP